MIHKFSQLFLLSFTVLTAILLSACAPPTAKIKVSRNEIKPGDPVTVSWETKNSKKIELNGEKVEKIGARTFNPKDTTDFKIIARRGKKEAADSATVKVEMIKPAAPTVTIKAAPDSIERGQNTKIAWQSTNARIVTISGFGEVDASGEREISPTVSTTYTATALGDGGNATSSTRVTVTDPPPPVADRPRTTQPPDTGPPIEEQFRTALGPVYFDYNRAELRPGEQDKLRRASEWLNLERNRSIVFRIEGNCDPRGTSEYNLGLGDRRAQSVKDFLISLGIDASRIEIVSYGAERAQGSEEGDPVSPPSWAHDRRADFIYISGGVRP